MEKLERRKFLAKAGKIAAGLGGLYLAATIPGCGKPNGGSSPQAESEPATPD